MDTIGTKDSLSNIFTYILLLLFLTGLSSASIAQSSDDIFASPTQLNQPTLINPDKIAAADFNGDGFNDVVTTTTNGDIIWYPNSITGFSDDIIVTENSGDITSLSTGDLNGDSRNDIIVTYSDSTIRWHEQQTTGGFSSSSTIAPEANSFQYSVHALSDIDGDGDTDVIAGSAGDRALQTFTNDGSGTFTENTIFEDSSEVVHISIGKIDDNDSNDLILSNYVSEITGTEIVRYSNNGQGSFSSRQLISNEGDSQGKTVLADINNDGNTDIISGEYGGIIWHENDGSGNFSKSTIYQHNVNTERLVAADVGNDDIIDVYSVTGNDGDYYLRQHFVESDGTVSTSRISDNLYSESDLALSDVADNNFSDLLLSNEVFDRISYIALYNGSDNNDPTVIEENAYTPLGEVSSADVYGSTDIEPLLSGYNLGWFAMNADGSGSFNIIETAALAQHIVTKDVTSDDRADLIATYPEDSVIAYYPNASTGDYGEKQIVQNQTGELYSIAVADVIGNSDADIIVSSDSLYILENNGDATFADPVTILTYSGILYSSTVAVEDIDQDGDMDILTSYNGQSESKFLWLENDNGSFSNSTTLKNDYVGSFNTGDLNGDSYPDILMDDMTLLRNDGSSSFVANDSLTALDINALSFSVRDFDKDGDNDFVVSGLTIVGLSNFRISFETILFTNNGSASFDSTRVYSRTVNTISPNYQMHSWDYENDGDYDLLLADETGTVRNFKNETVPTSSEESIRELPNAITLKQNYPNPFNPTTTIQFSLPESQDVSLTVYNILGKKVATLVDGVRSAGQHDVEFNADALSSGMYIYQLRAENRTMTQKMMLIK